MVGDRPRSEEAFLFQRSLIWGATGRILHNFFDVLATGGVLAADGRSTSA
jgi:hypothetical protein